MAQIGFRDGVVLFQQCVFFRHVFLLCCSVVFTRIQLSFFVFGPFFGTFQRSMSGSPGLIWF